MFRASLAQFIRSEALNQSTRYLGLDLFAVWLDILSFSMPNIVCDVFTLKYTLSDDSYIFFNKSIT